MQIPDNTAWNSKRTVQWHALLFALSFLTVSSCIAAPRTDVTSAQVPPKQGLVVGRIQVLYNGDDVTARLTPSRAHTAWFALRDSAGKGISVPTDEAGFFFAYLPVGSYELGTIGFDRFPRGLFIYSFEPRRGAFEVPAPDKIYDLGRIRIDWNGPGFKLNQLSIYFLPGVLYDFVRGNGNLTIIVSDDSAEVSNAFLQRFGSSPSLVKSPMSVTNP